MSEDETKDRDPNRVDAQREKDATEAVGISGGGGGPSSSTMSNRSVPRREDRVDLEIDKADLSRSAAELSSVLGRHPDLYLRGGNIVLLQDDVQLGRKVVVEIGKHRLTNLSHELCRPFFMKRNADGTATRTYISLPGEVAHLCLVLPPGRTFRPLDGITSTPLLRPSGEIRTMLGYDPKTRMVCDNVPAVSIPANPSFAGAAEAMLRVRKRFCTFPFADAERINTGPDMTASVNFALAPGLDESSCLCTLLTAVCRASLDLAPATLFSAPALSGAGSGKGKLARAASFIAFGTQPRAITAGGSNEELDKRLAAELISAQPVVFVDNANNISLNSDILASVITERPASVRILGQTRNVLLNSAALILFTGNGISVSGDLVRRFIEVKLDPGIENPESREFDGDFDSEIVANRQALLTDLLTIWRWGCQQGDKLIHGKPLGSFTRWCREVRDPLLALGCRDVVDRLVEARQHDTERTLIRTFLENWWVLHRDMPLEQKEIHEDVKHVLALAYRSRQAFASKLQRLDGLHIADLTFSVLRPDGRWTPDKYQVTRSGDCAEDAHWGHRPHAGGSLEEAGDDDRRDLMDPMTLMSAERASPCSEDEADLNVNDDPTLHDPTYHAFHARNDHLRGRSVMEDDDPTPHDPDYLTFGAREDWVAGGGADDDFAITEHREALNQEGDFPRDDMPADALEDAANLGLDDRGDEADKGRRASEPPKTLDNL